MFHKNKNKCIGSISTTKTALSKNTTRRDNEPIHSSSCIFKPSSPQELQHKNKKTLFSSKNRFELLTPIEPPDEEM